MIQERLPSSFRDRSAYVFRHNGLIHRQITPAGAADYSALITSGLYEAATKAGLLIAHEEIAPIGAEGALLLPQQLRTISYPYEWCFSQLKAAALLTLDLQELALSKGLTIKDSSAYNVQFVDGKALFIDSSSFETYREGDVWMAYRQFCEHFLAPLLLMSKVDVRLGRMQSNFIDGIPIELASTIVGRRIGFNPWLNMHVTLHAKSQRSKSSGSGKAGTLSRSALLGLLKSLRQAVDVLKCPDIDSTWSDYSSDSSYDADGARNKHRLVASYLGQISPKPKLAWDLGANAGEFSRIFSSQGIETVAWDGDHAAVERNFNQVVRERETSLLPLVQDFANPSATIGWANEERMSFLERGSSDVAVALALIHHLVIGNSVPLGQAADFFARVGEWLIIEFVDPQDPRVQQLLSTRSDSHPYSQAEFESEFRKRFDILQSDPVGGSLRTLYLMRRKSA